MGFLGSSKSATTTQVSTVDNRQVDAKVSAQDSSVITAGAGTLNLADSRGAISAGGNVNVDSTSPQAWDFSSRVVDRAFATVAAGQAAAGSQVQGIGDTIAKLAQGSPIGVDWKRWLVPAGAVVAVVIGLVFLRRKG